MPVITVSMAVFGGTPVAPLLFPPLLLLPPQAARKIAKSADAADNLSLFI
jgi:hypothetical protein